MNNIKILKAQSLLQEVFQEALFSLNDNRLNSLSVIKVICSKGKESAKVFLDPTGLNEVEEKEILKLLKKAQNTIKQYLQSSLSWYKIPNFSYEFDNTMENINRLDSIFKMIYSKGKANE